MFSLSVRDLPTKIVLMAGVVLLSCVSAELRKNQPSSRPTLSKVVCGANSEMIEQSVRRFSLGEHKESELARTRLLKFSGESDACRVMVIQTLMKEMDPV